MGGKPAGPRRGERFVSLFVVFVLLAALVAACGGGDTPPTPTAVARAEATPTAEPSPTPAEPATPTPEPTATPTAGGPVVVDALWFGQDGGTVLGGTSRVKVEVG